MPKVSTLPTASLPLTGAETLYCVQGANSRKFTIQNLLDGLPSRLLLASRTASASAQLAFTEFNNALFRFYEFEFELVRPATDAVDLYMQLSTDGGASYAAGGTDYAFSSTLQQGGSPTGATGGLSAIVITSALTVGNAVGEYGVSGDLKLYNCLGGPARTLSRVNFDNTVGGLAMATNVNRRNAENTTNAARFLMSSGNIASGKIRMYGLK